jgi:hypothetical protein
MSRICDGRESQRLVGAHVSSLLVIDIPRLESGRVETRLSRPLQLQGPCLVAEPVADEVAITGIDECSDASGHHGGHIGVEAAKQ